MGNALPRQDGAIEAQTPRCVIEPRRHEKPRGACGATGFPSPDPAAPGDAAGEKNQGISTALTTWMTPFDCITLGIVTVAVPPFASVT